VGCTYCLLHLCIGKEISLSTKNDLLALIAYRGLGSKWATKQDAADIQEYQQDLSWWSADDRKRPSKSAEDPAAREEAFGGKLSSVSGQWFHGDLCWMW
jgi:hypothetical protein